MGDAGERLKRATSRLAGAFGRLHPEDKPAPPPGPASDDAVVDPAGVTDEVASDAGVAAGEADHDTAPAGDDAEIPEGRLFDPEDDRAAAAGRALAATDDEGRAAAEDEGPPGRAPAGGGGPPRRSSAPAGGGRRLPGFIGVPWELFRKSYQDRVTGLAAESAFYAVLSMFPGLLVLAAALGWLDLIAGQEVARRSQAAAVDLLGRVLTDQASTVVDAVHDLFRRQRRGVLTSALLFGTWALSRAFAVVIRALDRAYGLHEGRSWLNLRLTAVMLSIGSAVVAAMLLAMVAVGPFLGHDRAVAATLGVGKAFALTWDWVRSPLVFAIVVLWTATLYHLAPNRRAPWARDLPGATFAAALWLLVSLGFGTYLHLAARVNQIFGVLGGGMILMLWLYLLCLSLLLGGELNAVLLSRAGIERRGRGPAR